MTNHIALTVDLEDWYHGLGLPPLYPQVERDTDWILETFAQTGVHATFFVLGEVAIQYPNLVKKIAELGHEIGFHGCNHEFLKKIGPKQFANHLAKWLPWLEDLIGQPISGFRAPFFSVTPHTHWALPILAQTNLLYDASIYPSYNDRYGWPHAPVTPVRLADTHLVLFPVPLLHPLLPIAFSGGAYLRMLPWHLIEYGFMKQEVKQEPGMIYFHPWEVSNALPKSSGISLRARLTRYPGLKRMQNRLQKILTTKKSNLKSMKKTIDSLSVIPIWNPFLSSQDHVQKN